MQDTALILSGLIIGAIIGLTGVGGGSLMTPLLIMGFGVNPAIAVGTDLLFAAATKLGGTVRLARERLIAWRAVGLLSVGSLPAALLTMAVLQHLGPSSAETAAATKLGGTVRLARERLIAWRAVGLLSVGSLPAALLTMAVLQHLGPSSAETEQLIRQVLGVALLLTALATLHNVLASQRKKNAVLANNGPTGAAGAADLADTVNATPAHWALPVLFGAAGAAGAADLADTANATPAHWALPVLFGALIGSVVTLTSVGAGAIGVTALLILFPRLAIQRIIAVDLAYAVPLTLFAGLGHASLGQVDWHLLGLLLCGSLPGIWLGSRLLKSLNPQVTRTLLSTLLATIGIKLLAW